MSTRREFLTQATIMGVALTSQDGLIAATAAGSQRASMQTYTVPNTDLVISRIAYGCDRMGWDPAKADYATLLRTMNEPPDAESIDKAARLIHTALDNGITFFDLAAVYGAGKSEAAFGAVLKRASGLRQRITIQSKCDWYSPDPSEPQGALAWEGFKRERIIRSTELSLQRLGTDYLDILLLHSPNTLAEPEEIAGAFAALKQSGKVRWFGVSNHTPAQIALLKRYVRQPIVVNQIHLGLSYAHPLADGAETSLDNEVGRGRGEHGYMAVAGAGTLDYCRLQDIQVQAYSPLRGSLLSPGVNAPSEVKQTVQVLADLARAKNTTPPAVALAWLLRHPARIVPIIGTVDLDHLIENCAADRVSLSAQEWYSLFDAAAGLSGRRLI